MQLINISENLSKIEIEKFAEEIVLKNIIVKFFGNEFIVLYKNKNKNIDIFMINQGNRILFEQNNCIKSSNVTKILLMNLACANKTIYVYAEFLNNNKKESVICSFDERLLTISVVPLHVPIDFGLIGIFENNLFTLCLPDDYSILSEYSKDLKVKKILGQENESMPYFFPKELITDFKVNEIYFIIFVMCSVNDIH